MKKSVIALILSIVMMVGSVGGSPVHAAETTAKEANEHAPEEEAAESKVPEENEDSYTGAVSEAPSEEDSSQEAGEEPVQDEAKKDPLPEETESVPEEDNYDVQDPNPSVGSLEGNTAADAAESLTEESPENEAAATTEETGTAAENEAADTIKEAGTTVENEATATTKETSTAATNAPAQPSEMMEIVDSGHLTDESGKEAKLAVSGSLSVDDILSREILPTDVSSASSDCVLVGVPGEYIAEQDAALARINEIRWEACEEGVENPNTGQPLTTDDYVPLKWSKDMEYIARIRAVEAAFTGDHIRTSGKSIWTTTGPDGNSASFEDLAWNWSDTMIMGIEQWYSEKEYWVNNHPYAETGHYTSMINPSCRYVGLGTFCTEGVDYYNTTAGEFSTRSGLDESHMSFTGECVQMVEMIYSHLSSEGEIIGALRAVPGEKSSHLLALEANYWFGLTNVYLMSGVTWSSSDESIVTISADGEATAVSGGSAKVTAYFEEGNISGEAEFVIKGVQDPDSEKCGDNATWAVTGEVDDLTLTISGTGKMYDFWDKYEMESSTPWASYADDIRTVVIEDGITSIGDCAFQGCAMTGIIIPDSVTSIGDSAFQYCSNVTGISIPEGVTRIGNSVFEGCYDLTHISIPDSVTSIGDSAFENCYDLADISIPDGVTSIGSSAFYYCESLTDISIPSSVTSIGDSAFEYCSGVTSIAIPEGVTSIGNSVFEGCYDLTGISIPDSVTSIGDNAFYYCESLTDISIPDGVTSIGKCAFYCCSSLTDVKIPTGLEKIRDMTFYGCSEITEFTIPNSVTEIGESAFGGCSSAKSIILPDSVTYINEYAFGYCDNLETISLPANIQAIEEGTFRSCSSLTEITIPDSVERIGYDAFFNCDNLKSITIPDSVTEIEDSVFCNDTNLTDVNYGGSESDWNAVTIGRLNDPLLNAAIHFNSGANGHTHSWSTDYTVDQEPTCQTEGSESIHCLTCGAIKKTTVRAIPMKEHNYGEWTVSKEATCTESGSREKTCADCGSRVTEEIPTASHTWDEDYTIDRMATCTEEGSKSIHCTVCGSINETTVRTIPAKEHNYSDWSIIAEASCTEDGRRERVCADCGDIDSEEIPAAGHIWNKEYTVDKEPTYMNTGSKSIHCSVCDAVREGSTVTIPILQRDIGDVSITGIENKTYTGQEITQDPRITDGTRILSQGIDYTLSFRNNMTPGTATMTITGIGSYTGTVIKTFMILPGKTTRGDMFNLAGNVKVTWKEVPGAKYYKIYREGITDKNESREEPVIVTERLIGWDQQPGLTNGHAYRYRIVASLTGKGDSSGDSPLSYSKLMYRLKTVVIRSVKNTAPGKVTVKYDKTATGDSYVLQYCERQDMVGAKTKVVLGTGNTSYTIGGLKKGKTYYISIRVRKKVDGIDYYTTFGVPKKVTITK